MAFKKHVSYFLALLVAPSFAWGENPSTPLKDTPLATVSSSLTATKNPEEDFIANLGKTAIDCLTNSTLTKKERRSKFKKLFIENFDANSIANFVLGRYKRRATPDQLVAYRALFEEHIAEVYAGRFSSYQDEEFKVTRAIPNKKGGMWILSQIIKRGGPPLKVRWLVFKNKAETNAPKYKIYDVVVQGISMSITQRSEYAAIIQKKGGSVQCLIDTLKKNLEDT